MISDLLDKFKDYFDFWDYTDYGGIILIFKGLHRLKGIALIIKDYTDYGDYIDCWGGFVISTIGEIL